MKKVVVADTQFLVVEALKKIIQEYNDLELFAIADSVYGLNKILLSEKIDLLLTDTNLIDYTTQDLQEIRNKYPDLAILVLNNDINKNDITSLSKIGIRNIAFKTAGNEEVHAAIDAALKGKKYFCYEVLDLLLESNDKKNTAGLQQLSNTELEIVRQIAEGLTTKEIAEKKNLSFHTVMTHRKNIFRKTGVNNTSELLMFAMRNGFFDPEYYI